MLTCCCLGVVTVLALKPACASRFSFLDVASSAWLVATVWHPATNARITMELTIPVRVNSFFICFVLICAVKFWRELRLYFYGSYRLIVPSSAPLVYKTKVQSRSRPHIGAEHAPRQTRA